MKPTIWRRKRRAALPLLSAQHKFKRYSPNICLDHSALNLQDEVMRVAQDTWLRLQQIADLAHKSRTNLTSPLEEGLHLASLLDDLADSLRKERPTNLEDKEEQLYDKLVSHTKSGHKYP